MLGRGAMVDRDIREQVGCWGIGRKIRNAINAAKPTPKKGKM